MPHQRPAYSVDPVSRAPRSPTPRSRARRTCAARTSAAPSEHATRRLIAPPAHAPQTRRSRNTHILPQLPLPGERHPRRVVPKTSPPAPRALTRSIRTRIARRTATLFMPGRDCSPSTDVGLYAKPGRKPCLSSALDRRALVCLLGRVRISQSCFAFLLLF